MAGSVYLRRVQAINRNQQPDDVARGLQVGQEIGKLLGGLGTAIQGAQKNAIANKLMNTMDAPRAALVSPGDAPTPGGPQPGSPQPGEPTDDDLQKAMAADSLSPSKGTPQDLGQLPSPGPQPSLGINTDLSTPAPATTDSTYTPSTADDAEFQKAMVEARVGGGPTVGSTIPAAQPTAQPAAQPAANAIAPGVSTAGTKPHTGGVQELELMKEMQAMQAQKATSANTQAEAALKLADLRAKASGTGIYSMDAAIKRAQLMKEQASLQPKVVKPDKNAPPVSINSEPVDNDNQLNTFVNKQYGNGTSEAISSLVSDGSKEIAQEVDAQGNPVIDPATGQPKLSSTIPVPLGKNKSANIPLQELQTIVNQKNALRKKQGLPLFRVPGQDQSLGATQSNPYPVTSKLDALSRASGTWVRLPNGQIAQVP